MPDACRTIDGLGGDLPGGSIGIVASRYNASICQSMLDAAIQSCRAAGLDDDRLVVVRVPGAWELPLAAKLLLERDDTAGVIVLGAVIQGETTHDRHINRGVSLAIMNLGLQYQRPIGFGLLTCRTLEQAINRSGGTVGNKGHEAADAVIEMLRLQHQLSS